jgi:TRAP transporter TAXI family solute receptor
MVVVAESSEVRRRNKGGCRMRRRFLGSLLAVAVAAAALAGCGSGASSGVPTKKVKPNQLIAGSASQGGANYLIMSGWGDLMGKKGGTTVRVEATGGPRSNMELMGAGEAHVGVLSSIVAKEGYQGVGWANGKKVDNVRGMFGLNDLYMDGIALAKSGIKNIRDLEGKTVSFGSAGGTPKIMVSRVLEILGVKAKVVDLGQGDAIDALKNGQLDAVVFAGAFPRPAYVELMASHQVNFITMNEADLKKVVQTFDAFETGTIPKSAYKQMTADTLTLRDRYVYAVRADIDDEIVYKLVKATLDNLPEFQKVHKSLGKVKLEDMVRTGIPMHPGAIKAFEEKGIKVPANLIPPEAKT